MLIGWKSYLVNENLKDILSSINNVEIDSEKLFFTCENNIEIIGVCELNEYENNKNNVKIRETNL